MSNRDILIGMQDFSKKNLLHKIKGYKSLRVVKDKKPSWFGEGWRQTYTIVPKKY